MAEAVAVLLRRSLTHLASEVPASYWRLVEVLGSLVIELDVDGERFALHGGLRPEVVDGPAPLAGARITIPRAAIIAILDAEVALAEAVESDRIAVHGSLDDLLRAHDTLIAYVHAAVRAPSAPGLLAELRAGTEQVR
jgi:hypothetical protein